MQFKTYIAVGIIFVFVFRTHAAYAQESAFAIEQGFGQSATGYAGGIFVLPVDDTKPDVSSIGLSYYSRPVQALFRLNAGLAFYSIDDDEASFKYLRLPAGLELCLDGNCRFYLQLVYQAVTCWNIIRTQSLKII